jgi:hypothetical protein
MGNRPVIEVTTGEFLSLRYKSGFVVPWALATDRENEMVLGLVTEC